MHDVECARESAVVSYLPPPRGTLLCSYLGNWDEEEDAARAHDVASMSLFRGKIEPNFMRAGQPYAYAPFTLSGASKDASFTTFELLNILHRHEANATSRC